MRGFFMDGIRPNEELQDNKNAVSDDPVSSAGHEKAVKSRKKWIIIGITAVLVIAGVAFAIYLGLHSGKNGTYYFSFCEIEGEVAYTAEELANEGIDVSDSYLDISGDSFYSEIFGIVSEGTITFNNDDTFLISGSYSTDGPKKGSFDKKNKTIRILMNDEYNVYYVFKR